MKILNKPNSSDAETQSAIVTWARQIHTGWCSRGQAALLKYMKVGASQLNV